MIKRLRQIGPGAMVAAAFIGPGTVTSATLSGANYGYTLLWAITFATISTCILQEMSMRLGVAGRKGLGEAIRFKLKVPVFRVISIVLVIASILIGNAAYEAGNITGVSLGSSLATESSLVAFWVVPAITAFIAFGILFTGRIRLIELSLMTMVAVMGIVFIVAAVCTKPDFALAIQSMFVPEIPKGSGLMVVALIGTTIVPYNLFLHASSSMAKWSDTKYVSQARWDSALSITFGGLITMAILIAAAGATNGLATGLKSDEIGSQLTPLLGKWSATFMGVGFIAAGLSSAITAPLAASYATMEITGNTSKLTSRGFRSISAFVIITGLTFALFPNLKPESIILFAQVANGLILPVIALFLLWVMNDKNLLGSHCNKTVTNLLGLMVVAVTILLCVKSILSAFHLL